MAQVIDFAAKKKELERKKKASNKANSKETNSSKEQQSLTQKVASETSEAEVEAADTQEKSSYDFDKIMRENASRRDQMNQKRSKDNESVKRSYRLKGKREPQS
jgi:hypothetical protein